MQLQRSETVPELYVAVDAGEAPTGRLLYLLPPGTPSPPPTLGFADAWARAGAFLFLAQALDPSSMAAFAAQAWDFLADRRLEHTRVAWLLPPDGSGLLRGTTIPVVDGGTGPVVAFDATIAWRNVALELAPGTPVSVDEAACELAFGGGRVTAEWGRVVAGTVAPPVRLGFAGALQGCLRLRLDLALDDLDALDVGQRWFYGEPPDPSVPLAPAPAFLLSSLRFPLLAEGLTLHPCLDPLAPLDPTRSFLAFNAADAGLPPGGAAATVASYLRSTLDDAISLTPMAGGTGPTRFAALVFAVDQQASAASGRDPLYLTPSGDFTLSSDRTEGLELMGGLSGVEYFTLGGGAVLSYVPGGDAYAPGFLPGRPAGVTQLQPTDVPTTSYAAIGAAGAAVQYYAQPDQSVLYNYGDRPVAGVTTITPLAAVPVHAATLAWPPGPNASFPLLAFAGLRDDLDASRQLEAQVVSPARRNDLAAAPPQATPAALAADGAPAPSALSTTPQGLLASYVPGGDPTRWESIVLGQMELHPPDASGQLALTGVDGDLLSAFQSNQMCLVVSDPAAIQPYLTPENARITIGQDPAELWQFDLDPARWAEYRTVLIVKFFDRSIEELAREPLTWRDAAAFNADPSATAEQIAATIADAKAALAAGDDDYAAFVAAVGDRSWNGILALSVRSPLDDLPSELEGLAVGIDPARFTAHHVAIEASKVTVPAAGSGTAIGISSSSIFGLIHYQALSSLPPFAADWAFQVQTLEVLFARSAVAAFSSTVDLQVNVLFGEPATLDPADGVDNTLELYGVYQKHVVNGKVVESYAFQTQSGRDAVFAMTSQVLNAVVIQKAQFVTVTSETTATSVVSQFLFWGLLDFRALASGDGTVPFDVLSFGRAQPDGPPAGLAFANLILAMSFDPSVTPEVAAFAFDASALALDPSASTAREGSLFEHFPLTVAGVVQGTEGPSPDELGFMGVQTPLTQSAVACPWYSLDFDLDLGSPGGLAAQTGFVGTLTAAWAPGTGSDYRVFTGLKLPGSSGSKRAVQIQSVLDIGFKSIEIVVPEPGTFILVLYGIAFEFLSLTFPPSGQVNFALFGDPSSDGKGAASLGWYAAYAKSGAAA